MTLIFTIVNLKNLERERNKFETASEVRPTYLENFAQLQ